MKKNTFSLLSSNWMFTDQSKSVLFPFLFSMISGKELSSKNTLPETTHYFKTENETSITEPNNTSIKSVAVINVHHPIFKYDQECGPKGTQTIMSILESWKNNNSIVGVVFDVNSGGGQGSGNSEFAEYLFNYPKPTVTYTNDTIGSAAYYFSAGTDLIIANKHADFIGCIGSMVYSIDMEGILTKKGATIHELYADISPEKNKQSRALKNGDTQPLIETIINPSAQKFHDDLKKYRPQISELALKGDVFPPATALKEGLIDQLGTLQTAIDKVFELSKKQEIIKNNHSKTNLMSKLNVPLIETVIGSKFSEGENENGIILTDEQATALENKLAENETAISNAATSAEELEIKNGQLITATISVETAVKTALETAEVPGYEKMSTEAGIVVLSNLISEYGSADGAASTQTQKTTDNDDTTPINEVGGIDISEAMNN